MSNERRIGAVRFDAQVLAELLYFPDGVEIVDVKWDSATQSPVLYLSGEGMPLLEPGCLASGVPGTLRTNIKMSRSFRNEQVIEYKWTFADE